jgi:hypothetical protein
MTNELKPKRKKRTTFKESDIARYLVDSCFASRIDIIRMPLDGVLHSDHQGKICFKKNHLAGFADYMMPIGHGAFWFVETKSTTGILSESQKMWAKKYYDCGSRYFVISSTQDVDELVKLVQRIREKKIYAHELNVFREC